MKNKFLSVLLIGAAALALAATGCAHAKERSHTFHEAVHKTVVAPPGWTVASLKLTNSATGNELDAVVITAPGTNDAGFWASLAAPRPRIFTDYDEIWSDDSSGGGTFIFTDPSASSLAFSHTNQTALGGSRSTGIGQIQSVITTNAVQAITAGGSAVGNVIGAAASAAAGK